jgi:cell division protein FtsZ
MESLGAEPSQFRPVAAPHPASGTRAKPRSGLFADPPTAEEQPAPALQGADAARPSLFGTVTGVFRRRSPGPVAAEAQTARVEPVVSAEQRPESAPRPMVRPVAGDEMGIEIPTFLRRQSS